MTERGGRLTFWQARIGTNVHCKWRADGSHLDELNRARLRCDRKVPTASCLVQIGEHLAHPEKSGGRPFGTPSRLQSFMPVLPDRRIM